MKVKLTESLNPFIWPALRNFKQGIRVNISIRHSVDKSVAVMSSSWIDDFSHSTCMTCSLTRPEKIQISLLQINNAKMPIFEI